MMAIALCIVALGACGRKAPEPSSAPKPAPVARTEPAPDARKQAAFEEPSEEVLRQLMLKAYEKLDGAGGLPMTVTATGHTGRVRMKLSEVRKADCKLADPFAVSLPGLYECSVILQVKYWWDGQREPDKAAEDNKRISVIRDDHGAWLDCTHDAQKNKAFCDVTASRKRLGLDP